MDPGETLGDNRPIILRKKSKMKGAEIAKCYLINQRKVTQHIAYDIYQKY